MSKAKATRERQKRKLLEAQNAAGKGAKWQRSLEDAQGPAARSPLFRRRRKGREERKGKTKSPRRREEENSAWRLRLCRRQRLGVLLGRHLPVQAHLLNGAHAGNDHRS